MSDEHKSCCGISRSQVLNRQSEEGHDGPNLEGTSNGQGSASTEEKNALNGQGSVSTEGKNALNGQGSGSTEGKNALNGHGSGLTEGKNALNGQGSASTEGKNALNGQGSVSTEEKNALNGQGNGSIEGKNVLNSQLGSSNEDKGAPSQFATTQPEMVRIPGGKFLMGTNVGDGFPQDGEAPIHNVRVKPFQMAVHTVTNAQFSDFIQETGYVTDAEKFGWSFVFYMFVSEVTAAAVTQKVQGTPWWWVVEGATWDHPEGPDSDVMDRMDHPVVHVSWNDAHAYCEWAGVRLPTEAEWELAARGGLEQKRYPWGDELTPNGEHLCNIWQGDFPRTNTEDDGYVGTAPAVSFPANGYGLYNVSGNVWEWCSDWFATNIHKRGGKDNPAGPPGGEGRVMRGGSYLCHHSYCNRYRVGARSSNTPDSSTGNMGFRVVRDV